MTQQGTSTPPPVARRHSRGGTASSGVADGALEALLAESAAIVARGRRILSPRLFWSRLAEQFSPLGSDVEAVQAQIDSILGDGPRSTGGDPGVEPLPGVSIVHGHSFYAGQWLGRVTPVIEQAWSALLEGAGPYACAPLIAAGFATARPPRVDAVDFSLVVAPHCDDAALALGGTLVSRLAHERPVVVEVFTVSNWLGEGLRPRPPEEVTPLRRREEEISARLLGARTLGLGFWDVDCRTLQRSACEAYRMPDDFRWELDPALRPREELDRIRAGLAAVATRLRPRRIYLPLGLGGQSDHRLVAEIAASMRSTFTAAAPEVLFYEDQPYASKPGLDVENEVRTAAPDLVPELVDVTDAFERKVQAVAAHRSQFSRGEIEPTLRRYASLVGGGRVVERLWRAPRW